MKITHYDLFAGIGGFSLALDRVFNDATIRHIFCEWEQFPTAVLKQHWPDGEFWGDIHDLNLSLELGIIKSRLCQDHAHTVKKNLELTTLTGAKSASQKQPVKGSTAVKSDTKHIKLELEKLLEDFAPKLSQTMAESVPVAERLNHHSSPLTTSKAAAQKSEKPCLACSSTATLEPITIRQTISSYATTVITESTGLEYAHTKDETTILTGGFPCQPFSAAGRRRGTEDARWLWPEMFRTIQITRPEWVIAENVRGFTNWGGGMAFDKVLSDLEAENYSHRAFIIPAVAVNAPHRRDRVWIVANRNSQRSGAQGNGNNTDGAQSNERRAKQPQHRIDGQSSVITDTRPQRRSERSGESLQSKSEEPERSDNQYPDWQRNWQEVAVATCNDAMDDGLPRLVDGVPVSRANWRKNSLKAYGNGIVHQIAVEIFNGIKLAEQNIIKVGE